MDISTKRDGDQLTIALTGKLDTLTSPDLADELAKLPSDVKKLVFDMKGLEYISSAGLRVLLGANKHMGEGNMKVCNVNEMVGEVLNITGFADVLTIE